METLNLQQAAAMLNMHSEEVRRRAKAGRIPGAKIGKCWVFIESDLADYIRSLYSQPMRALQISRAEEMPSWPSTNGRTPGGSTLPLQTESEYATLLGLPTKP